MIEAKVKWVGGIKFEGQSVFGLPIIMDGAKAAGGTENGYKPTELVLYAVAGCTGIDVVKILEKMRQILTDLEIEVRAYYPDEYPKPFNKVEIHYIFTGKGIEKNKVEQAIKLSEDKYCMVSQTLKGTAEVITSYEIREG